MTPAALRMCIYEVLLAFDEVSVPRELSDEIAQAIEARSGETASGLDPKDESAVRKDAPQ